MNGGDGGGGNHLPLLFYKSDYYFLISNELKLMTNHVFSIMTSFQIWKYAKCRLLRDYSRFLYYMIYDMI